MQPVKTSSPRFCMRLSDDERALFETAAKFDGKKSLGTWFKVLARARVEAQRGALRAKEGGADG